VIKANDLLELFDFDGFLSGMQSVVQQIRQDKHWIVLPGGRVESAATD